MAIIGNVIVFDDEEIVGAVNMFAFSVIAHLNAWYMRLISLE